VFADISRWIFWLNLPILAIGFVGVVVFLNLKPSEGSLKEKLVKIDYLGCFLFVTSITSFLISISWGGVMYKWVGNRGIAQSNRAHYANYNYF